MLGITMVHNIYAFSRRFYPKWLTVHSGICIVCMRSLGIEPTTFALLTQCSTNALGVIFDDQLTFKEHIAKTARSCRFALHNIRKIRPFLTEHAAQLLVQALVISRLDYCNALLAGLPSNTIKPLQMIQNAAARLVFNEPKRAHVTPLFVSLHWLPVAARIQFKTLMLAYRTTTGSAPTYFHSLLRIYIPSRSLRSASERRLVVPSQRGSKSLSRTFSFTVPGRWNDLPTPPPPPHPECWIPVYFQATTENSSLSTLLDYIKKKKKLSLFQNLHLSLYLSLLPLLACTYLNNAWDLVLLALPLYVCLFKINRFMYSPIVSRFG